MKLKIFGRRRNFPHLFDLVYQTLNFFLNVAFLKGKEFRNTELVVKECIILYKEIGYKLLGYY